MGLIPTSITAPLQEKFGMRQQT